VTVLGRILDHRARGVLTAAGSASPASAAVAGFFLYSPGCRTEMAAPDTLCRTWSARRVSVTAFDGSADVRPWLPAGLSRAHGPPSAS
jgi:hypothetical protein